MEESKLTLEELKPFLPSWYWELKKRAKEEKEMEALRKKGWALPLRCFQPSARNGQANREKQE